MEFKIITFSEREQTDRETEIAKLLADGWEIVSINTVMSGLNIKYSVSLKRTMTAKIEYGKTTAQKISDVKNSIMMK